MPRQPSGPTWRVTFPHASNCSLFKDRTAEPNLVAEGQMMPTSQPQVKTFLTFSFLILFFDSTAGRQPDAKANLSDPKGRPAYTAFTCQVVSGSDQNF
jgi:hypothetical protein